MLKGLVVLENLGVPIKEEPVVSIVEAIEPARHKLYF
jgi:hypothetical protein